MQTDRVLHNTSNQPTEHKIATFNCVIQRLNDLQVTRQDKQNERNITQQTATNND
jgi:hypothetical protein